MNRQNRKIKSEVDQLLGNLKQEVFAEGRLTSTKEYEEAEEKLKRLILERAGVEDVDRYLMDESSEKGDKELEESAGELARVMKRGLMDLDLINLKHNWKEKKEAKDGKNQEKEIDDKIAAVEKQLPNFLADFKDQLKNLPKNNQNI